jgi:hypothetical protein
MIDGYQSYVSVRLLGVVGAGRVCIHTCLIYDTYAYC